ncbi:MAG TPA: hypothetical protein VKQ08_04150 [Cyclobacteriaceae bacterium]|nr:hypothetical protein [Cyclobacteriaceae bacterium]
MLDTLKKSAILVLPHFGCLQVFSQSTNATLNEDHYHWVTRYEIRAGRVASEVFTSVRPFQRKAIVAFVDSLEKKDQIGRDTAASNWGSNILLNNNSRSGGDYGHFVGQGVKNMIAFADFTASYMVRHNLFIDFKAIIRRSNSPATIPANYYNNNSTITAVSLRWNIPARSYDF